MLKNTKMVYIIIIQGAHKVSHLTFQQEKRIKWPTGQQARL